MSHHSLVLRASLRRMRPLSPGIQSRPYSWGDLVEGPAPRRGARGDGLYVAHHHTDDLDDIRLHYQTVIRVDAGQELGSPVKEVVRVEERLCTQRRVLHELVERERAFSEDIARRLRARLRRRVERARAPTLDGAPASPMRRRIATAQERAGMAGIRVLSRAMRLVVDIPDAIFSRGQDAGTALSSRGGRRRLLAALKHPGHASPAEKALLLATAAFTLLGVVLLLNTIFALGFTAQAPLYQRALRDFAAALLGTLLLPLPFEPLIVFAAVSAIPIVALVSILLGKLVASWMLYLLGDALNDSLRRRSDHRPRLARVLLWLQQRADKYGFWLLAAINFFPLVPDLLIHPFAVSGMRPAPFLKGIMVGTLLKAGAIVVTVLVIGPDRVTTFLGDPLGALAP